MKALDLAIAVLKDPQASESARELAECVIREAATAKAPVINLGPQVTKLETSPLLDDLMRRHFEKEKHPQRPMFEPMCITPQHMQNLSGGIH